MNRVLKTASYLSAPKLTFAALNPGKAAVVKAGRWTMNRVRPRSRKPPFGMMALKGLGAAALAVPVGLWLGRKARGRGEQETGEPRA